EVYSGRYRGLAGIVRSVGVGDCAKAASPAVHVTNAIAIVTILRDIRFSSRHARKRSSRSCAWMCPGQALDILARTLPGTVVQRPRSGVLNTCPIVQIDDVAPPKGATTGFDAWLVPNRENEIGRDCWTNSRCLASVRYGRV